MKAYWFDPEVGHAGFAETYPKEYERRVTELFDRWLGVRQPPRRAGGLGCWGEPEATEARSSAGTPLPESENLVPAGGSNSKHAP